MNRFVVVKVSMIDIQNEEVFFVLNKDFKLDEFDSEYFMVLQQCVRMSNTWYKKRDSYKLKRLNEEDVIELMANSILQDGRKIKEGDSRTLLLTFLKSEFEDYTKNLEDEENPMEIVKRIYDQCDLLKKMKKIN